MSTRLVANMLAQLQMNVREIHSRMNQNKRNRASEEFRRSKGLVLVSSDVSARGVDYPDVTLVVQVTVTISLIIESSLCHLYTEYVDLY